MMTTPKQIQSCKVDFCPNCSRKLCKRTEIAGSSYIYIKHRGLVVYGIEAVIACVGCGKMYSVNATNGLVGEVNLEL